MLLISSSMLTVLPTPAPPNRPILPPFANGMSRSMTLMPVTSSSWPPACSSYDGAGRWIGQCSFDLTGPRFVLRRAEHVHDAAERAVADRHGDRRAGGLRPRRPRLQAFGGAHGDRAHDAVAELLLHFEREVRRPRASAPRRPSGSCSRGNSTSMTAPMIWTILPVAICVTSARTSSRQTAAAPPTISAISLVIAAWRALL